jgi:predicted dienelactone hydrolase
VGRDRRVNHAAPYRRRRQVVVALGAVILAAMVVVVLVGTGLVDGGSSSGLKPDTRTGQRATAPGHPTRSTTTPTTHPQPQPPYAIQTSTVTLTDPSRNTPARGDVAAVSGRILVTDLLSPVGATGPLPLIVFAHGWNSDPSHYTPLLDAWASAGYLVAAPTFPDSTDTTPGEPVSDYADQARDLSFVITSFLDGLVPGVPVINPHRIAAAGHSDGGTDVALMALNPAYADPRVKAYLSLSSEIPAGVDGPWGTPTAGSLLVAVGTADEYGLFPNSTQVYQTADMVKAFITVSGGDHLDTFVADTPQAAAVRDETVRFLQAALGPGSAPVTPATLNAALDPVPDPSIAVQVGSG